MDPLAQEPSRLGTFTRLLTFLRPYRVSLAISVVLAVASQACGLAIPWLTGEVVNNALLDEDEQRLWILIGLILAFGVLKALFMVGRRFIAGNQALGVEFDLRNALYSHLLRLSFRFFDRNQTGQLMSRATVDLQNVRFFLGYGLIFLVQHILTVIGVTVILFVIDWRLALIALAITPLLVAVAWRYSHVSHPVLRDVQQRLADMTTVAEESIVGVNVVKAFAQEDPQEARFQDRVERVFSQSVRATRQQALYLPALAFLPLLAQAAVLLAGGYLVTEGSLSTGAFVSFNIYLLMLVFPLRMLGMWIGQIQRATAAGERIFQILDEPEEITNAPDARPLPEGGGRIVFEDVGFAFTPGTPTLRGVDLEIEPGRIVALIGNTGSGKSDTDGARSTLLRPDRRSRARRRRRCPGPRPRLASPIDRNRRAGAVSVLRDGAGEHAFGAPEAEPADVEWAARAAQAHEFVERLPDGSTPSSANADSRCPAASASVSRSRGHCSSTRGS